MCFLTQTDSEQADRGNNDKRQNTVLDWSQDRVVKKVKGKQLPHGLKICMLELY